MRNGPPKSQESFPRCTKCYRIIGNSPWFLPQRIFRGSSLRRKSDVHGRCLITLMARNHGRTALVMDFLRAGLLQIDTFRAMTWRYIPSSFLWHSLLQFFEPVHYNVDFRPLRSHGGRRARRRRRFYHPETLTVRADVPGLSIVCRHPNVRSSEKGYRFSCFECWLSFHRHRNYGIAVQIKQLAAIWRPKRRISSAC